MNNNKKKWIEEELTASDHIEKNYTDKQLIRAFDALYTDRYNEWEESDKIAEMQEVIYHNNYEKDIPFKNILKCANILNE